MAEAQVMLLNTALSFFSGRLDADLVFDKVLFINYRRRKSTVGKKERRCKVRDMKRQPCFRIVRISI